MKKLLYPLAFTLTAFLILYGCSTEEDDSDLVKTSPPPLSELQPGRILSNENIYINGDGTGNFRTHCEESHVNNMIHLFTLVRLVLPISMFSLDSKRRMPIQP